VIKKVSVFVLHASQQSWLSLVLRRLRELESAHEPS